MSRRRLEIALAAQMGDFALAAYGAFDIAGVTALFGPSGAGKSTVLHAVAGFRPALGRVAVDGVEWQGAAVRPWPPHRRPVGVVFQDARLFEHLDVAGNLAYAARRADRAGPAIAVADAIAALDLGPLLTRRTQALSGGEQRRVAIARALLTRPQLLLMDEPLSGLDRARKAAILPLIRALPERFGLPVVFVSHIVDEIAQIADRLIAMRGGEVIGDGPALEMLEQLAPDVTGRFEVGALIEGRLVTYDAGYDLSEIAVGPARILAPGRAPGAAGDPVRLRFRARDVSLALAPVADVSIRNQLPARVLEITLERGAYAEVTLDVGGQRLPARVTRRALDALGVAPGDQVVALVKSASFDRRLGAAGRGTPEID